MNAQIRELVTYIRRHKLTYSMFSKNCHAARKHLGLVEGNHRSKRLPKLLTADQLKAFYSVIDKNDDPKHQIMFRLLLFTAVRVSELCSIRVGDVDLASSKIFINQGKGAKDRYVLFPGQFALTLKTYIRSQHKDDGDHLFESSHRKAYSTRRIHQIITEYGEAAGLEKGLVHPHKLRHQMISYLTSQGLADSQIQLISGHASKKSLERYQHMSLEHVSPAYNEAMKKGMV